MYAYQNLKSPQNISSGVADKIFVAPKAWIDDLKVPTAPFTNPGDEITTVDTHIFAAGKGFAEFQLAPQKNSLAIKPKGDLGLNGQTVEVKIFLPGSYAEAHEQVKNLMNTPLIAILPDSNCGANLNYQLGCDCMGAYLVADFTTGTTKDGVKGYEATITYDDGITIYEGDITKLP